MERTIRAGGTLKNLFVRITANTFNSGNATVTTRLNRADTSQTISITPGSTGTFEDTSNNVTVSAGDEINYWISTPSAASIGTEMTITIVSNTYTPSSNTYVILTSSETVAVNFADNTTRFCVISSRVENVTTEGNTKQRFLQAGTLKHGFVNINTNTVDTTSTISLRKNGSSTGVNTSISISSTATGLFEDTTSTDTVSSGEDWNWQIAVPARPGSLNLGVIGLGIGFETTDSQGVIFSSRGNPASQAFNVTNYYPFGYYVGTTTEGDVKTKSRLAFTAKNLVCAVTANSIATSASTAGFRKSGSSAITVSITASTTGIFSNTSDTTSVVTTDDINFILTTPNTSGTLTAGQLSVTTSTLTQYTKTFTIDTVLKKTTAKTFTMDTVLKKTGLTKTFTIDTVLVKQFTKTFTIDAVLLKTTTKTFTIDAVLKKTSVPKTFTIDTVLLKTQTKTFTIDTVLSKQFTKTFTIDAVLTDAVSTKTFTIDTVLNKLLRGGKRGIQKQVVIVQGNVIIKSRFQSPMSATLNIKASFIKELLYKLRISSLFKADVSESIKLSSVFKEYVKEKIGIKSRFTKKTFETFQIKYKTLGKNGLEDKLFAKLLKDILDIDED